MWLRCVSGCLMGILVIAGGTAPGGRPGAAAEAAEAAVTGAALPGLFGAGIGHRLDPRSQFLQADAVERTLTLAPSGAAMTWSNPRNGIYGAVSPMRTYRNAAGAFCREFEQTVTIAGQPQQSYGTACRQPDGTWRIQ